jgi:hypothetical protein
MTRTVKAWACIGSNGWLYVTDYSVHPESVDRYQVYQSESAAVKNDTRVVPVTITYDAPESRGGGK